MSNWIVILLYITFFTSVSSFSQKQDTVYINSQLDDAYEIFLKSPKEATKIAKQLIDTSNALNYHKGIIESNALLSDIKYYEGDLEHSLELSSFLIEFCKTHDSTYLPRFYYTNALTNFKLKKHFEAIENVYDAFSKMPDVRTNTYSIQCNILLADIHHELGNTKSAIEFTKAAYDLALGIKDNSLISYTAGNLGSMYLINKVLDSSAKYLKISKLTDDPTDDYALVNKTNYHFYTARHYLYSDSLDKALYHIRQAENLVEYDKNFVPEIDFLQGQIYFERNDYNRSMHYIKNVIENSKKNKDYETLAEASYFLSQIYYAQGKKDDAYQLMDKCRIFKDSAHNKKNRLRIAHLNSRYESERKDNEINKQKLKINNQEAEIFKKQQYNILISLSLLLALLTITLILYVYKLKLQKRKAEKDIAIEKLKTKDAFIKGEASERKLLSLNLQDGINASLSALKYRIAAEKNDISSTFKNSILKQIDEAINNARGISNSLSSSALDHFGLIKSLEDYCQAINNITPSIDISFTYIGKTLENISENTSTVVYRIVQELLNNSIKHSKATAIIVQITRKDELLSITVEDNGIGFNFKNEDTHGLGLKNLKSRADYIDATFDMISDSNGTSTFIEVDLSAA